MNRRWQDRRVVSVPNLLCNTNTNTNNNNSAGLVQLQAGGFGSFDHNGNDDLMMSGGVIIPQVTVVLEGRSICQRISLHKHANYQSLAKSLRHMFVHGDGDDDPHTHAHDQLELDLSNAVPGHLIAYEDMDNDLLLVGDLNWKDFVRVAKRIRIVPVKANSSKARSLN